MTLVHICQTQTLGSRQFQSYEQLFDFLFGLKIPIRQLHLFQTLFVYFGDLVAIVLYFGEFAFRGLSQLGKLEVFLE